jgi:hypothetical protein
LSMTWQRLCHGCWKSMHFNVFTNYLILVCDRLSPGHISPYDAHFWISLVVVNNILYRSFHQEIIRDAMDLVELHLSDFN